MSIQAIDFIDPFNLTVLLYKERKLFDQGDADVRTIDIWARLKLREWNAAKSAVFKALGSLLQVNRGERPALAGVSIEKLMPHSACPWTTDPEFAQTSLRFHLPIVTNPKCQVMAGTFTGHLPVGQLTFVASDVLHCAVNHGDTPRYHLIIDVKKPEPEIPGPSEPAPEEIEHV